MLYWTTELGNNFMFGMSDFKCWKKSAKCYQSIEIRQNTAVWTCLTLSIVKLFARKNLPSFIWCTLRSPIQVVNLEIILWSVCRILNVEKCPKDLIKASKCAKILRFDIIWSWVTIIYLQEKIPRSFIWCTLRSSIPILNLMIIISSVCRNLSAEESPQGRVRA